MADLELRDKGASLAELGYSERRQRQQPTIRTSEGEVVRQASLDEPGTTPQKSIAHLRMEGVMRVQDGISSRGIRQVSEDLEKAYQNPHIAGVLLEVDSGGGEALAGTIIQNTISERNKPVFIYGHTIASAAYKAVTGADKIYTSAQESRVGSIGTMASINKRLASFYQENYDNIYADKAENKGLEFREYLKGNKGPITEQLNQVNEFFLDSVRDNRQLTGSEKQITDTLSGRIFNAKEAQRRGLIDGVVTQQEATRRLIQYATKQEQTFNIHQTERTMSKTSLWQRLIQGINSKLGTELQDDATEEQAVQAVESAQSIDEVKQEIEQKLETQNANTEQSNSQLEQKLDKLSQRIDDQTSQIQSLQDSKTALETQLAEFKSKKAAGKREQNGTPPQPKDYETVQDFMQSAAPEGTSKY